MTMAQLEQRVLALEQTVEQLKARLPESPLGEPKTETSESNTDEEEFIPGAEYDVVLSVPPKQEIHLRGKLRWIRPGRKGLALSDAEWASLQLEGDDE